MILQMKKILIFLLVLVLLLVNFSCGAQSNRDDKDKDGEIKYTSIVKFIDVQDGECMLVKFSDGKTLLVDCGQDEQTITKKVTEEISKLTDTIDYFVYSHPDAEHTGNAESIINTFNVKNIFIPKILQPNSDFFPDYTRFVELAQSKNIEINYSECSDYIAGEDYLVAFLTPLSKGGSYARFNSLNLPTESDADDLSPIIYIDVEGTRIVTTGDAGKIEENDLLNNLNIDFYNIVLQTENKRVNLENIDFLKVSNGGASKGSSQEFLNVLKPKNAVISVGGGSYTGYPETSVLKRLQIANEDYKILRTDIDGDISLLIDNGELTVKRQGETND